MAERALIADKGCGTNAIIETALENCVEVVIPPKKSQRTTPLR
jgi:hypothetical protein